MRTHTQPAPPAHVATQHCHPAPPRWLSPSLHQAPGACSSLAHSRLSHGAGQHPHGQITTLQNLEPDCYSSGTTQLHHAWAHTALAAGMGTQQCRAAAGGSLWYRFFPPHRTQDSMHDQFGACLFTISAYKRLQQLSSPTFGRQPMCWQAKDVILRIGCNTLSHAGSLNL